MGRNRSRRIDDELVSHAFGDRAGIKREDRQMGQYHQVTGRIHLRRQCPHDLLEIERVDGFVDDNHDLGVAETMGCCHHPHADGPSEPADPALVETITTSPCVYIAFTATTSGKFSFTWT
jgi:hypothetical protein